MKRILCGFLLLSVVSTVAAAQGREHLKTPEERAQRQTEFMTSKLNLTPDQQTKVYEVSRKTMKQLEKFRAAHDTANVRAIRVASDGAYQKILTQEQFKLYEEMKQQRLERGGRWKNKAENNESQH